MWIMELLLGGEHGNHAVAILVWKTSKSPGS